MSSHDRNLRILSELFPISVLLLVTLSMHAHRASACSCLLNSSFELYPPDGAVEIPRSTSVWVGGALRTSDDFVESLPSGPDGNGNTDYFPVDIGPEIVLRLEDGSPLAGSVVRVFGSEFFYVFVPSASLPPSARISVQIGPSLTYTFVTSEEADIEPPARPSLSVSGGFADFRYLAGPFVERDCTVGADVRFSLVRDQDTWTVFADGSRDPPENPTFASDELVTGTTGDKISMGHGTCHSTVPDAAPFQIISVYAGSFDFSGNFSGWSDVASGMVPPPGCACTCAIPSVRMYPQSLCFAVLLLLIFFRPNGGKPNKRST
jgi:hypothetical protein